MKILHTSDWHLGKRLMKLDRSEEHQAFLNWLIQTIKEEKIDVLMVAGDIFDVPNPPHQSLEMFYRFLHRLSVETNVLTYIIAGNHDSGILLEAPKELLKTHRVKVWGKLSENPADHWERIEIKGRVIDLCALPFFRSFELLPQGEGDAIAALRKYLEKEKVNPRFLLFHHLAGVYEAAGSEQAISLSGVDSIPVELLRGFEYVALGHIHKPQKIADHVFYSGSPIPLRFSETLRKSVMMIEVQEELQISKIEIPIFRALHMVKADINNWEEKLTALPESEGPTPMVEVQLKLPAPVIGITEKIKTVLADKGMELLSFIPMYELSENKKQKRDDLFELSPVELFTEFYANKYKDSPELPENVKNDFISLLNGARDASSEN